MTMSTVLGNMLNDSTKEKMNEGKIVFVDLDILISSKDNKFSMDPEGIELLANSIHTLGLQQPLTGVKTKQGIELNSGHRRRAALSLLTERGIPYTFFGRELIGEAPIIYICDRIDELDKKVTLIGSNNYRNLAVNEKIEVVKECAQIYEELAAAGRRPDGLKRDWISMITGFSARSVQDYLKEEIHTAESFENSEKKEKKITISKKVNYYRKLGEKLIDEANEIDALCQTADLSDIQALYSFNKALNLLINDNIAVLEAVLTKKK